MVLALLFIAGSLANAAPMHLDGSNAMASPANPTGVDVRVVDAAVSYTDSVDESKYKMFSSNHPILGFNRPAELFVVDGMVNVSATLTITVENIGTNPSGTIDVNVRLLHDDYAYFEFTNTTVQMSSLAGGSSNSVGVVVVPSYAGNHTLSVAAIASVSDDNPSNDVRNQPFTVGHTYFNCDSTTSWSFGSGWTTSTDTALSQGLSCHAGNGQFSTYNNNVIAALTTPVMDLSDALRGSSRTNGISFYYTGSTAANDVLTIYGKNSFGAWVDVGSITGTIDNDFSDSANWQTFSVSDKGHASPLIPIADDLFHRASQFKLEFTSDASGSDIGYYLDDIVIVYEQKVRPNEFNVSAQGISTTGSTPGEWGSITMRIVNTGNISETFIPRLDGLPPLWDAYFLRPSGTSFDPLTGLTVVPGTPSEFTIRIQPDANATIGFQQMTVNISSAQYPGVSTMLPVQYLVKADRIPVIQPPAVRPSCPPSFTCTFEVGLSNDGEATDVFDVGMDVSSVPSGWSINMAWTQSSSVLLRPGDVVQALFTVSVPETAAPDTVVEFDLTLQAQNDTSRVDSKTIGVSASMLSDATVGLSDVGPEDRMLVEAGSQISLKYTIHNNASRQDIFSMRVEVDNPGMWTVHQPTRPDAVLNSGGSTTFTVMVDVPANAQANDRGPTITPVIESKRSLMEIRGEPYDGLRVQTTNDVKIEMQQTPTRLTPGIANELHILLTNNGNGATEATIAVDDAPSSWSWWLTLDGQNITDTIPLSVSYDLAHEANISLWILLPMTEAAGELHTITITATHAGEGVDLHPDDNAVEVTMSTASIRVPSLDLVAQSDGAMAGGTIQAEVVLSNLGNAVEDRLSVVASVSSTPYVPNAIAFFSVGGGNQPLNQAFPLVVNAGGEATLMIEVLVPDDAPLNARFVLEFEVIGAVDEDGLPQEMKAQALVIIDQQRMIESTASLMDEGPAAHGTSALVQVNLSSMSSLNERIITTASGEQGWQVSCNKMLVNESGMVVDLVPGHVTTQTHQHRCEVLRMNGPIAGLLSFSVATEDGYYGTTHSVPVEFGPEPESSSLGALTVAAGGGAGLVLIGLVAFLLRRRPATDSSAELEDFQTGPPASMHVEAEVSSHQNSVAQTPSGPPVSSLATVEPEPAGQNAGPPLPESGLPAGWTEEQWAYYGQQYLDGTL